MTQEFDLNQLTHYLAGECTPEEARVVDAWLGRDTRNQAQLDELRVVWGQAGKLPLAIDAEGAWRKIAGGSEERGRTFSYRSLPRWVGYSGIVAVAVFAFCIVGIKYFAGKVE